MSQHNVSPGLASPPVCYVQLHQPRVAAGTSSHTVRTLRESMSTGVLCFQRKALRNPCGTPAQPQVACKTSRADPPPNTGTTTRPKHSLARTHQPVPAKTMPTRGHTWALADRQGLPPSTQQSVLCHSHPAHILPQHTAHTTEHHSQNPMPAAPTSQRHSKLTIVRPATVTSRTLVGRPPPLVGRPPRHLFLAKGASHRRPHLAPAARRARKQAVAGSAASGPQHNTAAV